MFAIAFDLDQAALKKHYAKSASQAYEDIRRILEKHTFLRIQGSVYTSDNADMTHVFYAMQDLHKEPWIKHCVSDIRAFRVENWSDFTSYIQGS